jgi:hypothetical protein
VRIAAGVGGRQLLGLFPTSAVLSGIYVALGAWGLWAGRRLSHSVRYARMAGLIFALLLVLGHDPGADTMFGMGAALRQQPDPPRLLAILCFLFGWLYRHTAHPAEHEAAL